MSRTLTIEVTQDDIDMGEPGLHCLCAVALAIKRVTGQRASVGLNSIGLRPDGPEVPTPTDMAEFIDLFDEDKSLCRPETFILTLPDDA